MPHFHHFSICNQNQSISNLVIFEQNTKAIALLFGQKLPHFHHVSICNQNQSISYLVICEQNTKAIALLFGQKCLIFITFQSAIKINQFQIAYQGYSLTFWPKMPHFHHFHLHVSINFKCNQKSFSSLFNLQSKSINFKFGHL